MLKALLCAIALTLSVQPAFSDGQIKIFKGMTCDTPDQMEEFLTGSGDSQNRYNKVIKKHGEKSCVSDTYLAVMGKEMRRVPHGEKTWALRPLMVFGYYRGPTPNPTRVIFLPLKRVMIWYAATEVPEETSPRHNP